MEYTILNQNKNIVGISRIKLYLQNEPFDYMNEIRVIYIPAKIEHDGLVYYVTTIMEGACTNSCHFNRLIISEGITNIESNAFEGCKYLEEIIIPSTISEINPLSFANCRNLSRISISDKNPVYNSKNNCNAIIETSSNTILLGCSETKIAQSIKSIGEFAFQNCNSLKEIILPDSLENIGPYAFAECINLKNVKLPSTLKSIGDFAFKNTCIEEIDIPVNVNRIGINPFIGCNNLKKILVDKKNAQYYSSGKHNIIVDKYKCKLITGCKTSVIPKSVKTIAGYAFGGNVNLKQIIIPKNVTNIINSAFNGCINLTNIAVSKQNKIYDSRDYCNAIITSSSNSLHIGCSGSTIPASVNEIEDMAFAGMNTITVLIISNNIRCIGSYAFQGCCNIESLYLPDSKCQLGVGCFMDCINLQIVKLPYDIHEIPENLFENCYELNNVDVPYGCKIIGDRAFYNNYELSNINVSGKIFDIGIDAFHNSPCKEGIIKLNK